MPHTVRESGFSPFTLFCLFTALLLAFCLLGIATRPYALLASFWPANSILLGILIRYPGTRSPYSLLGAFTGYILADLFTGSTPVLSIMLTAANLIYVMSTLALYLRFRDFIQSLHRGYFYLFMFLFCMIGSLMGAIFAASVIPHVPHNFMNSPFLLEMGTWFTAEIQNALLLLPLILSMPHWKKLTIAFAPTTTGQSLLIHLLPCIAVILSLLLSSLDPGPGALLYSIAALIWCALTYRHFFVAVITSTTCAFIIFLLSREYLVLYPDLYAQNIISLRFGVIMMAIAPLTVSSINETRSRLIRQLQHALAYDELTSCLSRRQFLESASLLLQQMQNQQRYSAVFMLDIDHFKQINDSYGHLAGDRALQVCAQTIQENLRSYDLLGRLGGEEFAVLLTDTHPEHALQIAERIRNSLSAKAINIDATHSIHIQTSIGVCICPPDTMGAIDNYLKQADDALYQAKRHGRNRVITSTYLTH